MASSQHRPLWVSLLVCVPSTGVHILTLLVAQRVKRWVVCGGTLGNSKGNIMTAVVEFLLFPSAQSPAVPNCIFGVFP